MVKRAEIELLKALLRRDDQPVNEPVRRPVLEAVPSPVTRGKLKRIPIFRLSAVPEPSLVQQVEVMLDELDIGVPPEIEQ